MKSIEYQRLSHSDRVRAATEHVIGMDPDIRPHDLDGEPGGLIEFSGDEDREFIVVGDLHAMQRNLACILLDSGNIAKIRRDEAVLVFLGDVVHNESSGELAEMESSIRILDVVIHLLNRYPRNIVYLLGNHDTFDARLAKSGIQQGKLFRETASRSRGDEYVEALEDFFGALPLFVKHPHFLSAHAGPVRNGVSREGLINAYHSPDVVWQLTWNRLNETRSNPSMKEYGNDDLTATRSLLGCPDDLPFIVGHNPMWRWGGDESVWLNPSGTDNHVILYANHPERCPYLSFAGSPEYSIKYAEMRLKRRRFVLDNYA